MQFVLLHVSHVCIAAKARYLVIGLYVKLCFESKFYVKTEDVAAVYMIYVTVSPGVSRSFFIANQPLLRKHSLLFKTDMTAS